MMQALDLVKENGLHIAHLENITSGIIVHKKGLVWIIVLNWLVMDNFDLVAH